MGDFEEIKSNYDGVIFDTDVLVKLDNYGLLLDFLLCSKSQDVEVYYPTKYDFEVSRRFGDLRDKLTDYRAEHLLSDIPITERMRVAKREFMELPFDYGEAYCYAIAEIKKLAVITDDKLAAYSYLVFKHNKSLLSSDLYSEDLFEQFYSKTADNKHAILRLNLYSVLKGLLKKSDSEIASMNPHIKPRSQEWFSPMDIASENEWLSTRFSSKKSCYLSIGAISASVYALPPSASRENFHKEKHWEANIGLKMKSTTRDVSNITLVKKDYKRYGNKVYPRRLYNFIAYNAIVKYLSIHDYLIAYLAKSSGQYLGKMEPDELKKCMEFCGKFRKLYDQFRRTD